MANQLKMYSPTRGGFYLAEIHGENIPDDAVEITDDEHAALMDGQSKGMLITAAADGRPVLTTPPGPTENQITLSKIAEIEASVTDRRIREAVLGIDGGWLKTANDKIADLRKQIK